MTTNSLSRNITALMLATIALFLVTLSVAGFWMAQQLNERAEADSIAMTTGAIEEVEEKMRAITIDYSHWDTAYIDLRDGDHEAFYDDYAMSATVGDVMHLLAVTGGPVDRTLSWIDGGPAAPAPDHVPVEIIDAMRARMAEVTIASKTVPQFFAPVAGDTYLFSSARIQPYEPAEAGVTDPSDLALAVIGYRVDEELLTKTQRKYLLSEIRLSAEKSAGSLAVPLAGADGVPGAYLEWDPPLPGDAMLVGMSAPLAMVTILFLVIAIAVMSSARRSARNLVAEEARARMAARTDALTGLPNRYAVNDMLDRTSRQAELAVLFLDINGFKTVNDTVGHQGGDELVIMIADRLRNLDVRPSYMARVGGDEFVLMVEGADAQGRACEIAHLVKIDLLPQFRVDGHAFHIGAAIGLAARSKAVETGLELLRRADLAMYKAKRLGCSDPIVYDPAIENDNKQRHIVEEALREGLRNPDEFSIVYQPIIDGKTGQMVRAEALARWTSPKIGRITPDVFIGVAEETGLMVELGSILLEKICNDLVRMQELKVSINISPAQLNDGAFVEDLIGMLRAANIDPGRVEVEVTEGLVVSNVEMAAFRLDVLHEAGLRTSLDDFGTGFSSIGYLAKLPFDTLKIDKSFASAMCHAPEGRGMVQAMILMGHSLGQIVVCEGVETEEQATALRELACDLLQGYLFSAPVALENLPPMAPERGETRAA